MIPPTQRHDALAILAAIVIFQQLSAFPPTATVMAFALMSQRTCQQFQFTAKKRSTTGLSAILPPPSLIIGPMIKRFQENNAKKNLPVVDRSEAAGEAPGLRVGSGSWKWPGMWPYDASFFIPVADTEKKENMDGFSPRNSGSDSSGMMSMLSGINEAVTSSSSPTMNEANGDNTVTEMSDSQESSGFDSLQYWSTENEHSVLSEKAAEKVSQHLSFYLEDGVSILEFGAASKSYLPATIFPSRHVGIGTSDSLMATNPSLTERYVVDLNNVTIDQDVNSEQLKMMASQTPLFDVALMTDTVQFLTRPREVFRTAWRMLRPGGRLIVAFTGRDTTSQQFTQAQTSMWRTYNDDQRLWITGSFFQFSAADGWEQLLAFDLDPEDENEKSFNPLSKIPFLNQKSEDKIYVVQAMKGYPVETIDPQNLESSIKGLCWMLPTLEERDKGLVIPRLVRACQTSETDYELDDGRPGSILDVIQRNVQFLPDIYEVVIKMDQFAFPANLQAQLAADLVANSDFTGSEEELVALKQGLGLRTPSPEFWAPVGAKTAAMSIDDKINLLTYLIPSFRADTEENREANREADEGREAFVTGLDPTYAVLRNKRPQWSDADVQLLGTELLAAEVLKPGVSSREEFAVWLMELDASELEELLASRKAVGQQAKAALKEFKATREARKKELEEYRKSMDKQVEEARKNRSLIFNPRTQKMEILKR